MMGEEINQPEIVLQGNIDSALHGKPGDLVLLLARLTPTETVRIHEGRTVFKVYDHSGPERLKRSIIVEGLIKDVGRPQPGGFIAIRGGVIVDPTMNLVMLMALEAAEIPRPEGWPA
ncbi:MAG: hypothetical protein ACYC99_08950 [Candidatus Geothermincolia bacterium]